MIIFFLLLCNLLGLFKFPFCVDFRFFPSEFFKYIIYYNKFPMVWPIHFLESLFSGFFSIFFDFMNFIRTFLKKIIFSWILHFSRLIFLNFSGSLAYLFRVVQKRFSEQPIFFENYFFRCRYVLKDSEKGGRTHLDQPTFK